MQRSPDATYRYELAGASGQPPNGSPPTWFCWVTFQIPAGNPYFVMFQFGGGTEKQIYSMDHFTSDPTTIEAYQQEMVYFRQVESAPAANNMVTYSIIVVMPYQPTQQSNLPAPPAGTFSITSRLGLYALFIYDGTASNNSGGISVPIWLPTLPGTYPPPQLPIETWPPGDNPFLR
jgi:hypothetical protein